MKIVISDNDYREALATFTLGLKWDEIKSEARYMALLRMLSENSARTKNLIAKMETTSGPEWWSASNEVSRLFKENDELSALAFGKAET